MLLQRQQLQCREAEVLHVHTEVQKTALLNSLKLAAVSCCPWTHDRLRERILGLLEGAVSLRAPRG